MSEELVGTVTHYFARPQVGIVKLSAAIKLGGHAGMSEDTRRTSSRRLHPWRSSTPMLRRRRPEPR